CGDRETEIRTIAKEIKQLVLREGYDLGDIALVVRQRAAYAATIARVMQEESIRCTLELRLEATEIPANRAALKLFGILEALATDNPKPAKTSEIADLIKSEYFQLSDHDLVALSARFDQNYSQLLQVDGGPIDVDRVERLKRHHRIGSWDADALENTF